MERLDVFDKQFSTDDACKAFLVAKRWPTGVRCPRCKSGERIYALKARPFHWVCKSGLTSTDVATGAPVTCNWKNGYRFSVLTHTIFQDTKVPLVLWFKIAYLMATAKKGMSSLQVRRIIFGEDSGTDWRTCWYICHRWRAAMKGDVMPLTGEIEIDETFVGGKAQNMHASKRKRLALVGTKNKVAVIGAIARKGMVVAKVIENTDTKTLDSFVRRTVGNPSAVKLVATDEHDGYRLLGRDFNHGVVKHSAGEYVVGSTHTNTIEGFWSLFKRGIIGSYHKVGKTYLPLYVNEFAWRFNNRKNPDAFGDLITTCGK